MTALVPPTQRPVNWGDVNLARHWLARRGIRAEPTWSVTVRLVSRVTAQRWANHRMLNTVLIGIGACFVPLLLGGIGETLGWKMSATLFKGLYMILPSATILVAWWRWKKLLTTETEVERLLPRRVAETTVGSPWRLVDAVTAASFTLTYGGGIGLGVALTLNPAHGYGWVGPALTAASALGAGFTLWTAYRILHRPALADDALALHVDERLRREDTVAATPPFLAPSLYFFAAFESDVPFAVYAYACLSAGCWLVDVLTVSRRKRAGTVG